MMDNGTQLEYGRVYSFTPSRRSMRGVYAGHHSTAALMYYRHTIVSRSKNGEARMWRFGDFQLRGEVIESPKFMEIRSVGDGERVMLEGMLNKGEL